MIFWLTTWKKVNSTNTHMFKNSKNVATGESIRWPIRVGNIPKWWDIHGDAKPLCLYFIKLFNVTHTHKSSTHHTYRRCLSLNNRIHKTRYATINLRSVFTMKNSVFEKKCWPNSPSFSHHQHIHSLLILMHFVNVFLTPVYGWW